MLKQNILLFLRSISREKIHFLLTLSGLALGLTGVLLAYTFIQDEQNFDNFHTKSDRIFRVNKFVKEQTGDLTKNAETPGLMAPTIDADFPEVELGTHVAPWFDEVLLTYEDQNTMVENWLFADSNFFQVFDFEMIRGGDPSKILSQPGQIIITQTLAQTLFGGKDPIGKIVKGLNDKDFIVAGLVQAAPRQSHIQYDAIVSWTSTENQSDFLNFSFMNNWLGQTVYTYLLLRKPEQIASVNEKLPDFTTQYMNNRKDTYSFFLQPLKDVYLQSTDLQYLRGGKYGSAIFLRTFSIIALMILLIACFNYINITTAKSFQRAKEVGVKKVLGAEKKQLIGQFLTETFGITILASFIAVGLAQIFLPNLNEWFGKDIPTDAFYTSQNLKFLLMVIGITGLVAGFFPSWLLTRFKPVSVLKSTLKLSPKGALPRQILTTLQLTISIGLIAGTILLHRQFNYILNKDLGFDKEQVLVMDTPPGIESNSEAFKNELAALPGIQSISICNAAVGDGTFGSGIIPEGNNGEEMFIQVFRVDSSYINTFGMELSEGRFLNLASDLDPGTMVVNEAFVKQVGWETPLERSIQFVGSPEKYPVVGVLKDFNFNSLHQEVSPLVMYLDERKSNTSVRLDPTQLAVLLPKMKKIWENFETRYPFDYYFVNEFFAEKYMAEQQMSKVITLFAFLAIFIACLGLYGLAAFAIARRTKEIGIRKVLGSSIFGIVGLLSSRFMKPVFVALFLAIPMIYHYSNDWLNGFAYHVELNWWIFGLAGIMVLGIVLLTVGFQSVKAALANPVDSLRSE